MRPTSFRKAGISGCSGSGVICLRKYWRVACSCACSSGVSGSTVRYCHAGTDDRKITPFSSATITGSEASWLARPNHSRLSLTTVTPITLPFCITGCEM